MEKLISSAIFTILFMSNILQAQDWANLNLYGAKNAALPSLKPGENRVVFMGNSITEGWSKIRPEFFENKPYINRGIGGQTTPQMLIRFRQDVVNLEPAVVVILAGTNDIAGNTGPSTLQMIADNIFSMVEIARANNIKVIISSVLPVFDYPWSLGLNPDKKIPELNSLLKKYADKNKVTYLDYFSAMSNEKSGLKREYGEDGVHPNKKGYETMEPLVEAAIIKSLKQK